MYQISIIIPIYKVERYIQACLDSIYSSENEGLSFEVICVNDGTPDRSMAIVENFANRYDNIKIVSQENQGQGPARDNGIANAQGKYIWTIDSDDWLESGAVERALELIVHHPDIDTFVIPAIWKYADSKKNWVDIKVARDRELSGLQYLKEGFQSAAWQFVVRRDLLVDNGITYNKGILHEDGIWGFEVLYLSAKVYIYSKPLYCYRQRQEGSVMSNITIRSAYDIVKIHSLLDQFRQKHVLPEDQIWFKKWNLQRFEEAVSIVWHLRHTPEFQKFLDDTKDFRYQEIDKCFSSGGVKWKLKCWLFKHPILNKHRRILQQKIKLWIS